MENIAYIDCQNTYRGSKDAGWKIDWQKFLVYLQTRYKVQRIKLFVGYLPENKELYNELQSFGYELIFRQVVRQNGEIKGNIDSNLMFEALTDFFYGKLDKLFLVSGDGDFDVLVNFVRKEGKLGKILLPHAPRTSTLLKTEDNTVFLQNLGSIKHIIGKVKTTQ